MNTYGPKQEPVAWTTIIGLAVAAAISYGFGITEELTEFLTVGIPVLIAAWVARQSVTPVPKADAQQDAAYQAGLNDAADVPPAEWGVNNPDSTPVHSI